jgi:enoyl-CoA hydratase/carnithine racemase
MISLSIEGSVAVATLCRAPVNAINNEWIARLGEVLDEVERAPAVSVLWIRSGERVFCAGADLAVMRGRFGTAEGRAQMVEMARSMQTVFARLERIGPVTIAELGGSALGGGFELALACDLRVVADTAKVGLPEARLGLLPGAGGTQRLTRLCGDSIARRLILGAELSDGAQAVALGIAHWTAPAAELQGFTRGIVERIGALPASALAACKRCIDAALVPGKDGYAVELAETALLYASEETQQRVRRFLDK